MKYTKTIMAILVVSLLTLNGCMLKHVLTDDEGMPMHGMMHSSNDEEDMHDE